MPEFEPTNSPTTAPTTASVTETFKPEKIAGIACGRLTAQNTWKRLPAREVVGKPGRIASGQPCHSTTTTSPGAGIWYGGIRNSRIVRSQATTMKIRNKNGRIHGAFSAFDTPPGPSGSATLRSLAFSFRAQINPLDKYCLVFLLRQNLQVVPAKAGTHTPRLLLGHRGRQLSQ